MEIGNGVFLENVVSLSPKEVQSERKLASEFVFVCLFNFFYQCCFLLPETLVQAGFDLTNDHHSSS